MRAVCKNNNNKKSRVRVIDGEMAGMTGRILVGRRILTRLEDRVEEFAGKMEAPQDMDFRFLEEDDGLLENEKEEDEEENGDCGHVEESKAFWEAQHQLLQEILNRRSSFESAIYQAIKEALNGETQGTRIICTCQKPINGGCRSCLLIDICNRLCIAGYNSAICKSKWRSSPEIPSGEHTYIDVVGKSSSSSKRGEVRVVIELNFQAEFEMARASDEYKRLVNHLPEVFVGKPSKLRNIIKIMCSASKKCMKENKMHMGPWRKHRYMEAKWLGSYKRTAPAPAALLFSNGFPNRPVKLRASMLTFDLHSTTVEIL